METRRKLQIEQFDAETASELLQCFPCHDEGHIKVGEKGYMFPARFSAGLNDIHNMEIRPDDVFVVTFPRSGTTWSQELVWLINNDCDFETAKSTPLTDRYAFIEFPLFQRTEDIKKLQENVEPKQENEQKQLLRELGLSVLEHFDETKSRRFIKTHLPLSILPPALLETAKVVYVARDPRDVCVSFYHMTLLTLKLNGYTGDFKKYWNLFKRDLVQWSPFFSHVKEAWEKRNQQNILFLFYEEMIKDMPSVIQRVSKFFGKTCNEKQIQVLCEHLKFDNFSKNKAVQLTALEDSGFLQKGEKFIRKGKAGGWRDSFDNEMTQEAEQWMAEHLRDTDLRFPDATTAGSE